VYIAKLDLDPEEIDAPEPYIAMSTAVDVAIFDAIDRGYIPRNFGKFWIVDGHIVIDNKPVKNCFHPAIEKCGQPGETQFCPDCERLVGWEEL